VNEDGASEAQGYRNLSQLTKFTSAVWDFMVELADPDDVLPEMARRHITLKATRVE
jgi:hypothetical protein